MNIIDNSQPPIEVSAKRFSSGTWSRCGARFLGEGDISAAYSADAIGMEGRIRKPFRFQNAFYATVSMQSGSEISATAYQLQQPRLFGEPTATYAERCRSDNPRAHPKGFYHGMLVRHGNNEWALVGPPRRFIPSSEPVPTQGTLW